MPVERLGGRGGGVEKSSCQFCGLSPLVSQWGRQSWPTLKTHVLVSALWQRTEVLVQEQRRGQTWQCPFWGQQVLLGSTDFQASLWHPEPHTPPPTPNKGARRRPRGKSETPSWPGTTLRAAARRPQDRVSLEVPGLALRASRCAESWGVRGLRRPGARVRHRTQSL